MYHGDIALGSTIDIKFNTVGTDGLPITLGGSPVISAYPDNSTTQLTAGITLTVDFDGVTGFHNVRVVATSGNGYAAASNYTLAITTGTIGGSSVAGYIVGAFSIEARSALRPTTAGRTLDVSATGEAGLDWANIGGATTTQGLSGTTVKTATDVETDTADIQTRLPAALVGGLMDSNVGAISGDTVAADNLEAEYDGTGYKSYLRRNTATGGGASTITLDAGAVATNDYYNNLLIGIISGTGAGQGRIITDYDGGTLVATVNTPWTVQPSTDSVFVLFAFDSIPGASAPTVAQIADGVWDELQSGHTGAGSFGRFLDAQVANVETDTQDIQTRLPAALVSGRMVSDMAAISGDDVAADALETMLDGTGGNVLTLSQLRINSTSANGAVDIDNSAGPGIDSRGTIGLYAQASGASNYGIEARGTGATDSGGIKGSAATAGEGIEGVAAGNGHGLLIIGAGTGEGLHATAGGGATAHGAHFEGVGAASSGLMLSRGGVGGDDLAFANNDCTVPVVTLVNGLAANVITSTAIQDGALTAAKAASGFFDAVWSVVTRTLTAFGFSVTVGTNNDKTGYSVSTLGNDTITAAVIATGAIDADAIADNAIDSGAIADGAITATKIATGAIDADALATDAVAEIADGILDRNIAGGSDGGRDVTSALRILRNRVVVDGTTITVYQEDDSTTAWSGAATRDAALDALKEINPT